MAGGTDNNKLNVAAEERVVVATIMETVTATKTVMVTAPTKMMMPTMAHQQQQKE